MIIINHITGIFNTLIISLNETVLEVPSSLTVSGSFNRKIKIIPTINGANE